ncbi:MAG: response regulator [Candidatus Omnitrophica bacterium]|nr:response regulator [Candidatus Omnitrophota bacterium]
MFLLWKVHQVWSIRILSLVGGSFLILSQTINCAIVLTNIETQPLFGGGNSWDVVLQDILIWSGMFLILAAFYFSTVNANTIKDLLAKEREELKNEIEERIRSQEDLRRSQTLLSRSQEIAHLGSWEWDFDSGSFQISDEALRIFGLSSRDRGEDLALKIEKRIHPDDRDKVRAAREDAINELNLPPIRYRVIPTDGTVRHIESEGIILFDKEGRPSRLIATILDLTDRILAEEEREDLIGQIQVAQKLESLGIFAGGVAHDLNNQLLTIMGNSDMILSELGPDQWPRQMIREIQTAGERMSDLCNQMLAFSGKGKSRSVSVNLTDVVRSIDQMLRISASDRAVLELFFEESPPPVEGDVDQIQQAVVNLVTNAAESIENEDAVITIRTGSLRCSRRYLAEAHYCGSYEEGEYVFVEVSDTGAGMDRETRSRMFDPFFTTKPEKRGLGMSMVLGVVRVHHGVIKVASEKGYGTTVLLLFPVSTTPIPSRPTQRTFDPAWKGTGQVLVVDDEASVRNIANAMLFRSGFDVTVASSGREGIRILEEHPARFEAVLLDWTMPGLNGVETYRKMKEIDPDIRVIFTSGFNHDSNLIDLEDRDGLGFIQKPYTYRELIGVLRETIEKKPKVSASRLELESGNPV